MSSVCQPSSTITACVPYAAPARACVSTDSAETCWWSLYHVEYIAARATGGTAATRSPNSAAHSAVGGADLECRHALDYSGKIAAQKVLTELPGVSGFAAVIRFMRRRRAGCQLLYIFLFRQFFARMPAELADAAVVDGCGWFKLFLLVYLPLARPAVVAVSMLLMATSVLITAPCLLIFFVAQKQITNGITFTGGK